MLKRSHDEARAIAGLLGQQRRKLVLAESCTGGQVSALLVGVPGISQWYCGSLVVYREASKERWLGISPRMIRAHTDVSAEVTEALARAALRKTPEASFAAAVTGHLGPGVPRQNDGLVYVAFAVRRGPAIVREFRLPGVARASDNASHLPASNAALRLRRKRQVLASQHVLQMVRALLTASVGK